MSVLATLNRRQIHFALGISAVILFLASAYAFVLREDAPYTPSFPPSRQEVNIYNNYKEEQAAAPRRVAHLHYLIPATNSKDTVCSGIAAALANGYPPPRILGYKGQGEFDAHAAHIAKLRTIKRYLYSVNATSNDDDLVIIVDGYDVLPQLPAEVMIERYFEMTLKEDTKLANQRGITVEELRKQGVRQTLVWGTDKGCFPPKGDEAQCWLIPFSDLSRYAWGPKSDATGPLPYSDSRFLNSGTAMGPLGDMRKMIDAALKLIDYAWDKEEKYKNSDQYYIGRLYARQEYDRIVKMSGGKYPFEVPGGKKLPPALHDDEEAELHIFTDKEYAFTQTRCHNDAFMHKLRYSGIDYTADVTRDTMEEGDRFRPYKVQMPAAVHRAFTNLWNALPKDERPSSSANKWIRELPLSTNVATQHMYAFYHHTCRKEGFVDRHRESWHFPIIKTLLRHNRKKYDRSEPVHPGIVDGRLWIAPKNYPMETEMQDEYGGVFTDLEAEPFIPFQKFCKPDLPAVIGEKKEPAPEEVSPETR
ncbi:hypothetical protein B0I35DRAFT_267415 [Stachybotrys elegans]|uniref:Uncharacterized protein n=1 Tax=Stachybotrys elegans TaxID=80388 RepID=A0A8K0WQR3_9HYPO|nr:hypothetical protein B0I35DRAFT_267415 [Stachybotrys elegans]